MKATVPSMFPNGIIGIFYHFRKRNVCIGCTTSPHYFLKIQSFSLLAKNNIDKHESGVFQAGGYKWKLVLHPCGNKTKNVNEHISVYLSMAETSSLPSKWEVHAVIRIFLLDQTKHNYLIVQGTNLSFPYLDTISSHDMVDQFIPFKTFTDSRNGYLVDDTCILGAEVFVSKEMRAGNGESVTMFKDGLIGHIPWCVSDFNEEYYDSQQCSVGNYKWKFRFYPKGKGMGVELGSNVSLYLNLATETLPSGTKVLAEFSLKIYRVDMQKHFSIKGTHWFSTLSPESGWERFMALQEFNGLVGGFHYCFIFLEVSVLGVSAPLH
ncbi:hypothetical protein SAY87_011896 [Trapa incisa]|uniref:MATH domain-containing protein n=1 Tax=Trapa incisa TaxID=236973 RepID=A0AAN7JIK4_9MYRT|nr:hypothetical protein SAY87_011896 [Trapa incisa]